MVLTGELMLAVATALPVKTGWFVLELGASAYLTGFHSVFGASCGSDFGVGAITTLFFFGVLFSSGSCSVTLSRDNCVGPELIF